jgi:hypothetical protein
MAKKQTRRTVSMSRDLFERAKERAAQDGMPLAAWVARLVTVELDDEATSVVAVCRLAAEDPPGPQPARGAPLLRASAPSETGPFVLRPLGPAGADVAVCPSCDTEHPRSGRISFVESSKAPSRPAKAKGVPA